MPQIITLSGMLGSGKSTVGKALATHLNFDFYSTGNAQREIAKQMGISTLELNRLCMTDPKIDHQIDGVFKSLSAGDKDLIVDSRLAFFFIPSSFKVKLNVDTCVAGERILNDSKRAGSEKTYESVDEAVSALVNRRTLEVERFINMYNVNIDNDDNFDYVIDTTYKTVDEIIELICTNYQRFLKLKKSIQNI